MEIPEPGTDPVLAPTGIASPHGAVTAPTVEGGRITESLTEPELGLGACVIRPEGCPLALCYDVASAPPGQGHPETAFQPRQTRYTRPAAGQADASRDIARAAGGGRAGIEALVAEAEARFTFAHPEHRFNDGTQEVPYLGCGTTPGSCVDINTYLVASLRAAGYEAAYLYGYFFPRENNGITHDMHCWVVTRHAGEVLEWDIAHHIKAGLGPTRAAPNPRPGARVALGSSMGHRYRAAGADWGIKLLSEPLRLGAGRPLHLSLRARLTPNAAPSGAKPQKAATT